MWTIAGGILLAIAVIVGLVVLGGVIWFFRALMKYST